MIEYYAFKELIGDFVDNNFKVVGQGTEAEVGVDDYKCSYEKAIKDLYMELIK